MLSLTTEKSNKKKKCVMENSPKIFKVPSLLDIVSTYLANEMLYEKCIQPATTGIFKSRWKCIDRFSPPAGCHNLTMGQWEAGERVGWHLIWHCILSVKHKYSCGCCEDLRQIHLKAGSKDWVTLRRMIGEYKGKIVDVYPVRIDYDASSNVIISTRPENPIQLKTKLFKNPDNDDGWYSGWQDGFELPRDLTKVFFPAKEML